LFKNTRTIVDLFKKGYEITLNIQYFLKIIDSWLKVELKGIGWLFHLTIKIKII